MRCVCAQAVWRTGGGLSCCTVSSSLRPSWFVQSLSLRLFIISCLPDGVWCEALGLAASSLREHFCRSCGKARRERASGRAILHGSGPSSTQLEHPLCLLAVSRLPYARKLFYYPHRPFPFPHSPPMSGGEVCFNPAKAMSGRLTWNATYNTEERRKENEWNRRGVVVTTSTLRRNSASSHRLTHRPPPPRNTTKRSQQQERTWGALRRQESSLCSPFARHALNTTGKKEHPITSRAFALPRKGLVNGEQSRQG